MAENVERAALKHIRYTDAIERDGVIYVPLRDVLRGAEKIQAAGQSIVRCRECKHFGRFGNRNYCEVFADEILEQALEPDDYCSRGERREEKNDGDV